MLSTNFVPSFDPNECCLKLAEVLNPGPLGHESLALTTIPRRIANKFLFLIKTSMQYANEGCKIQQLKNSLKLHCFYLEAIFCRTDISTGSEKRICPRRIRTICIDRLDEDLQPPEIERIEISFGGSDK
jgi:hypothetical protein